MDDSNIIDKKANMLIHFDQSPLRKLFKNYLNVLKLVENIKPEQDTNIQAFAVFCSLCPTTYVAFKGHSGSFIRKFKS